MAMVTKYQKPISGPVLDRIDIHLDVPRVLMQKLASLDSGQLSTSIRQRVEAAREAQHACFATVNKPNVFVNGDMEPAEVQKFCQLDKEGLARICMAVERMGLSARLKLSRTIADLVGSEQVPQAHLAESLQSRPRHTFSQYFRPTSWHRASCATPAARW